MSKDAWELSLHPHPVWEDQSPISVRQTMDGTMAFTLREFHTLTRHKHAPLAVHFCYDRPPKDADYNRIFKCPIRYSQPYTQFLLDKRHVAEPVVTSDFQLLKLLVLYAEQKLSTLEHGKGFANRVKQTVIHLVKPQFPTIQTVASTLNISVRTLQRRLKEESYTYQQLLDELKRQFAMGYLGNHSLSIKEIAYLLDYADASSFIRSFKRWKGKSPEQYRLSNA